jgi:peptide/nickel transport system substrate-binding protein
VPFDCGPAAFITLHTGKEAGTWSAPGTAQRLADGLAPERLQQFALGRALTGTAGDVGWGAKPCELLLQEGSPYLEALASTIASLISRPGHEVTPKALAAAELARRRLSSAYSLMLGVVRPFDPSPLGALTALTAAENPAAARVAMQHPPRVELDPRVITRTLRVGVLGDLRVMGAHVPSLRLARLPGPSGWDLASSFMSPV